jgi:hypothetical protein
VIGALLLPLRTLVLQLRGEPVSWLPVLRQFALALGILGGLWLAGMLLGLLLGPVLPAPPGRVELARHANLFRLVSVFASFGTLAAVLLGVQVARLVVARPEPRQIAKTE